MNRERAIEWIELAKIGATVGITDEAVKVSVLQDLTQAIAPLTAEQPQKVEEWEQSGLTPQEMWDEIQAVRKITGDDGTHGAPHILVEELKEQYRLANQFARSCLSERDEARRLAEQTPEPSRAVVSLERIEEAYADGYERELGKHGPHKDYDRAQDAGFAAIYALQLATQPTAEIEELVMAFQKANDVNGKPIYGRLDWDSARSGVRALLAYLEAKHGQ